MARARNSVWPLIALSLLACREADQPSTTTVLADRLPKLVARAQPALAVIEVGDRRGVERPLGAGFTVAPDGLIATSLHVIGEARPITVHLADGTSHEVAAVHAISRTHDLAVLRIDADDLPALELAGRDPDVGEAVLAFGNPQGMERSVVSGVVSALRRIDGTPMIQLAIPIEPGNSGGPVLDMEGRVHGVVTMKSRLTENLGFAVRTSALRALLQNANPIPMADWLTIGALDPAEWTTVFGALWHQRAGRIVVEQPGDSFGGRALCLSTTEPKRRPYTVGVTVRLDQQDGAAGLALAADGGHVHYGFYPSHGRLRFTRFGGPDVMSWEILHDRASDAYRPGEWNRLEVQRTKKDLSCFVNGRLVFSTSENRLPDAKVGLVKFRDTRAQFKHFTLTDRPGADQIPRSRARSVRRLVEREVLDEHAVDRLLEDPEASLFVLKREASRLERRAEDLRRAAEQIHFTSTRDALVKMLARPEQEIDLFDAALMVAQLDNLDLRIEHYRDDLARMATTMRRRLPPIASEQERLDLLNRYLFAENGFHGSRDEYHHRSNSYLNEVMDDREGLPLTLGVLYMSLGERLGLRIVGIGLPGHFLVQHVPRRGSPQLIDVFRGGKPVSNDEAKRIAAHFGSPRPGLELAAPVPKGRIIIRMLRNLQSAARREGDLKAQLRYLDVMLAIEPNLPKARFQRAQLRLRTGPREDAMEDLEWIEEHASPRE